MDSEPLKISPARDIINATSFNPSILIDQNTLNTTLSIAFDANQLYQIGRIDAPLREAQRLQEAIRSKTDIERLLSDISTILRIKSEIRILSSWIMSTDSISAIELRNRIESASEFLEIVIESMYSYSGLQFPNEVWELLLSDLDSVIDEIAIHMQTEVIASGPIAENEATQRLLKQRYNEANQNMNRLPLPRIGIGISTNLPMGTMYEDIALRHSLVLTAGIPNYGMNFTIQINETEVGSTPQFSWIFNWNLPPTNNRDPILQSDRTFRDELLSHRINESARQLKLSRILLADNEHLSGDDRMAITISLHTSAVEYVLSKFLKEELYAE